MEGGGDPSMMGQASKIWSMLDDMSESDPAAYKKFIDKQLKEGREFNKPPEPHMCILATIIEPSEVRLFINICEWSRVPKPKTDEDPVGIVASNLEIQKDDHGSYKVVGIAFNPAIIEDYGESGKGHEYTNCLVHLALDYLEDKVLKSKVSRQYTQLPSKTTKCKGDVSHIQQGFMKQFKAQDDKMDREMEELTRGFGPLAAAAAMSDGASDDIASRVPGSLVDQLSSITTPASGTPKTTRAPNSSEPELRLPGATPARKGLIEEVTSGPMEPEHEVRVEGEGSGRRLLLRVKLPGVCSVAECDLEVTKEEIQLQARPKFELKLPLPYHIDCDAAKAKFLKKTSVLTLNVPILS